MSKNMNRRGFFKRMLASVAGACAACLPKKKGPTVKQSRQWWADNEKQGDEPVIEPLVFGVPVDLPYCSENIRETWCFWVYKEGEEPNIFTLKDGDAVRVQGI